MYTYASHQPTGIVIMPSLDPNIFTIASHPYAYHHLSHASSAAAAITFANTYGPPPPAPPVPLATTYISAASGPVSQSQSGFTFAPIQLKTITQEHRRPFASRSASFSAPTNSHLIRRTRATHGHVSKTRVSKRGEANLTKICPSCTKLWRLCNCSNVKNRPAPKPYCKFIPPRMLKKQSDDN